MPWRRLSECALAKTGILLGIRTSRSILCKSTSSTPGPRLTPLSRMYPTDELAQEVREGYDPAEPRSDLNTAFAIADDWADEEQQGEPSRNRTDRRFDQTSHHYGSDEQAAWGSDR